MNKQGAGVVLGAGLVVAGVLASTQMGSSSVAGATLGSLAPPLASLGGPQERGGHPIEDVIGLSIRGADNKELGVVADLVLDSLDGTIDYVLVGEGGVLGIGDETCLVPFESFKVAPRPTASDEALRVTTTLNEERIRKAPRVTATQHLGPDVERAAREAAGLQPVPMQPRPKPSELIAAGRILGQPVLGVTQEKLGTLDDIFIEPQGAMVVHTVLTADPALGLERKSFTLAWEVTRAKLDGDSKVVIESKLTKETLEKAAQEEGRIPKPILTAPREQ